MTEPEIPQGFIDDVRHKLGITRQNREVLIILMVPDPEAGTGIGFDKTTRQILSHKDDAIDALIGIQIRKLYQDVVKKAPWGKKETDQ